MRISCNIITGKRDIEFENIFINLLHIKHFLNYEYEYKKYACKEFGDDEKQIIFRIL